MLNQKKMLVLSLISNESEGEYVYNMARKLKKTAAIPIQQIYSICEELQKSGYLKSYNRIVEGRLRKYYLIIDAGKRWRLQHSYD